jgi:hypothetical protein
MAQMSLPSLPAAAPESEQRPAFPCITFLGTGSSMASKYRGASAILEHVVKINALHALTVMRIQHIVLAI